MAQSQQPNATRTPSRSLPPGDANVYLSLNCRESPFLSLPRNRRPTARQASAGRSWIGEPRARRPRMPSAVGLRADSIKPLSKERASVPVGEPLRRLAEEVAPAGGRAHVRVAEP